MDINPYKNILTNFVIDTVAGIRRVFVEVSGPEVRGGSAWRSLDESKTAGNKAEIWGRYYFYWLTEGRSKTSLNAKNDGGPTLQQRLIPWIKRKFNISDDKRATGLSWVISKNIHERGWTTNREKRQARMVKAAVDDALKELEKGIDRETEKMIQDSIFKSW